MFTDRVQILLSAGKGGDGVIAWRREKYIPKGGPAGGNGGRGGSITLEVDPQVLSLEGFRNHRIMRAENGRPGGSNLCAGRGGKDLLLKIPPGTIVRSVAEGRELFDFTTPGQSWEICQGGRGGRGNHTFKSPTHQAPAVCTKGTPGESIEVELELKLIADVGFVGKPNAGKSTLISRLADIEVKIAPYPFTTLKPNLGLIEFDDFSRILIADIPGIIEGAHQDRGLGLSFLKHIERTSVLIYVLELVPWQNTSPWDDFILLQKELQAYQPELLQKPFLIVLNKSDLDGAESLIQSFQQAAAAVNMSWVAVSALEGHALPQLKETIRRLAQADGKRFR